MKNSRREFLAGAAKLLCLGAAVQSLDNSALAVSTGNDFFLASDAGSIPIMQGMTNEKATVLVTLIDKKKSFTYQIYDAKGQLLPFRILRREQKSHSNFAIEKVLIEGLQISQTYRFLVIDNQSGKQVDERTFTALDRQLKLGRFAVATCMNDMLMVDQNRMWKAVIDSNPSVIFLLGDTCYANYFSDKTEASYWRRYSETRNRLWYFRSKKLVPTLSTWDDHDFGVNNGNKNFKSKQITKEIFETFWANEELPGLIRGPGLSYLFSAWGQRFFVMDDRWFRDPVKTGGKHWGVQQENFLFNNLVQNAKPAWIMNGSQFFGGYGTYESFEGDYAQNFKNVLSELGQIEAPVNFVSGDVHFSEVMAIEPQLLGYRTFEYTSSSVHSFSLPLVVQGQRKNPRRLIATAAHNFLSFQSVAESQEGWAIATQSVTRGLKVKFRHETLIKRG